MRFWYYGAGMTLILAAFAWRYPLAGHSRQLADIGTLSGYSTAAFAGYVGGMTGLFALYLVAWRASLALPRRRAAVAVFAGGAAMVVAMGAMYPVSAIDLFVYAVRSRLFTAYGVDPIAVTPNSYPGDPLLRFASAEWADDVSPYGPLWNLIAAPATWLAGDRIGVALVAFKVLAGVSVVLGAWLIYRIVAVDRPERAATGALLYLWNPLVLWEGVGNGHNDVVLVVPVLLALLAWKRRRDRWVIPLLVVAALIKYVTVLLVPIAAVALWRRGGPAVRKAELLASSLGLSLAAVLIGLAPFYDLAAIGRSVGRQGDIFLTSPAAVVLDLLGRQGDPDGVRGAVKVLGVAILAACMLWQMGRVWQAPERLPQAGFEVMFVYVLAASWVFRSWYLIWLVALAAVLVGSWPVVRTIAWAAGAMAGYALFIWGWHWWRVDFPTIQRAAVGLMFGPVLVITCARFVPLCVRRWRAGFSRL
ncbi:MAG: alpha,6-mannosyltransferase [Thermomicrobiales bacterium]|nr:alpha,6-mannosyltransferase [Thermomicrobiales bacterium]